MKFEAKSMLNMLCQSLYDTLLVVLRENLQNAYDAVLMRRDEDVSYVNPSISIDVKDALLSLDEVTGEVITDDILNNIFEHFCIGK